MQNQKAHKKTTFSKKSNVTNFANFETQRQLHYTKFKKVTGYIFHYKNL